MNENKESFSVKSEGLTRSKFSVDYLSKFLSAVDPEKQLILHMSNNYPIKIDREMGQDAKISLILAKRIE